MKDYKLSELREMCITHTSCSDCCLCEFCDSLEGIRKKFDRIEIDEE